MDTDIDTVEVLVRTSVAVLKTEENATEQNKQASKPATVAVNQPNKILPTVAPNGEQAFLSAISSF